MKRSCKLPVLCLEPLDCFACGSQRRFLDKYKACVNEGVDDPLGRVDKVMDEILKTKTLFNIIAHSLAHTSPTSTSLITIIIDIL